jgi:hypothetical protein
VRLKRIELEKKNKNKKRMGRKSKRSVKKKRRLVTKRRRRRPTIGEQVGKSLPGRKDDTPFYMYKKELHQHHIGRSIGCSTTTRLRLRLCSFNCTIFTITHVVHIDIIFRMCLQDCTVYLKRGWHHFSRSRFKLNYYTYCCRCSLFSFGIVMGFSAVLCST